MASPRAIRTATIKANFGRDFGWFVEHNGAVLAELTDPRFEDMFWYSYNVQPLVPAVAPLLFTAEFWNRQGLAFRNRTTGHVITGAFAGSRSPTEACPRVWMRGLLVPIRPTCLNACCFVDDVRSEPLGASGFAHRAAQTVHNVHRSAGAKIDANGVNAVGLFEQARQSVDDKTIVFVGFLGD